jgi:serine/threonine-protein kinase RsbW
MTEPQLRLTFPSRPEYLVLGRLVLSGLARVRPIDPDTLGDLKLALTEASSNSIRHAYGQSAGTVEVVYSLGESRLTVEVSDEGPGFDAAEPQPKDEALDEGGLGLAIIHAVCDETELGRRPDGSGSWIRFAKRLDEEEEH